ncbi:MAG: type II toxin-antitoxin system VapC family toxin, partial [bacterium]
IIRELISVCTLGRNLSRPLTWDELRQQIEALLAQTVLLDENETSIQKLIDLGARYRVIGKQIHDTNIAATMLTHSITRLVTFNPDDFKRFTEIEVIVP